MRKQIFAFVLGIGVAGSSAAASGTGPSMSGNDLFEAITGWNKDSVESRVRATLAGGYIEGVSEALNYVQHPKTGLRYCFPPGATTNKQIIDIVLIYLRDHPEHRHHSGWSIVAIALAGAFPCKN